VVGLAVMLYAERDHPSSLVMLPLNPRRIEVMPGEIGAIAALDRTAETDFLSEEAADIFRRSSIHCGFPVGVGVGVKQPVSNPI
jgi:hypothetical protein